MIDIALWEALVAVADYKTLSAAAEHLSLTQPSLSRSMQRLEEELGVPLFERGKNKIVLNDTGQLAAEEAKRLLREVNESERRILAYDKSKHTLSLGSVAPGPLIRLLPRVSARFPDITITSEVKDEAHLLLGLADGTYQLIVLTHPVDDPRYQSVFYGKEQLYLTVDYMHPVSSYPSVTFHEMDGQNFIMYSEVGVWEAIVRAKMPHAKFFKQSDREALSALTRYSSLPSFLSNFTLPEQVKETNRAVIPFSDPEATLSFYLIYPKASAERFRALTEGIKMG